MPLPRQPPLMPSRCPSNSSLHGRGRGQALSLPGMPSSIPPFVTVPFAPLSSNLLGLQRSNSSGPTTTSGAHQSMEPTLPSPNTQALDSNALNLVDERLCTAANMIQVRVVFLHYGDVSIPALQTSRRDIDILSNHQQRCGSNVPPQGRLHAFAEP